IVARAIYRAQTPIISGTGHEIDNTIADYAADLRAPTPSAACELAIPDIMSAVNRLKQYEKRIKQCMNQRLIQSVQRLRVLSAEFDSAAPKVRLENQKMYLDSQQDRLIQAVKHKLGSRQHQYEILLTRLNGLSPTAKLVGGYGYIEGEKRKPICSVKEIKGEEEFSVTLWDGTIFGVATGIEEKVETSDVRKE
ncbi:MAG: exodeoxyribonuclease VII large subunit, partial [Lachnospiraceae bacterium]|nr:exodeoxyribonuclease VII large subunit [Lachnospiraceae bacterium]